MVLIMMNVLMMEPNEELPSEAATRGVFKNLADFTVKNLCWSFFLMSYKPSGLKRS